jgi:uncharacterized protein
MNKNSLLIFVLLTINVNGLYALGWNDVYQAKTGYEKHVKIIELAKQGDSKAQFILSLHYRSDEFVAKDLEKANKLLFESANNGYAEAEYMLGSSYNSPKNQFQLDHKKAVQWLQRAAKHGHIEAQYELGEHYHMGLGIKKDLISSYLWLKLASRNNSYVATRSFHIVEDEMTGAQIKQAKQELPVYVKKYTDKEQ